MTVSLRTPDDGISVSPSTVKTRCVEGSTLHQQDDPDRTLPGYCRYALNFKGLSYTTVWVEYPDIKVPENSKSVVDVFLGANAPQALCIEIGAEPTAKDGEGKDLYTLPVIKDPNTGKVVSDSNRIAAYLDEIYPEHPLVPSGTSGLQFAFQLLTSQILQNVRLVHLRIVTVMLNRA